MNTLAESIAQFVIQNNIDTATVSVEQLVEAYFAAQQAMYESIKEDAFVALKKTMVTYPDLPDSTPDLTADTAPNQYGQQHAVVGQLEEAGAELENVLDVWNGVCVEHLPENFKPIHRTLSMIRETITVIKP